jgi:hypothetical protein
MRAEEGRIGRVLCGVFLCVSAIGCGQTNATLTMTCPSPSGEFLALVVQRGGGGAAGWTETTLAVVPRQRDPAEVVAERGRAQVVVLNGETELRLHWRDASRLHVEFPDARTLFLAAPNGTGPAEGVRITYASAESDGARRLAGGASCSSVDDSVSSPGG